MTKGVFCLILHKDILRKAMPALPNSHFEPIIELTANREAIIEGCQGIVEYNDSVATINCKSFLLTFEGFDICLKSLSDNCISVTGSFTGICFSVL